MHLVKSIKSTKAYFRVMSKARQYQTCTEEGVFITDDQIYIVATPTAVLLRDLTNALLPGKLVASDSIDLEDNQDRLLDALVENDFDLRAIIVDSTSVIYEQSKHAWHPVEYQTRIKPLQAQPKKWTIPLVVRALVNGQCYDVQCKQRLTDDYAYDAATNYGAGNLDPIKWAKELVQSPSGWRAHASDNDTVAVNCHSFDYRSFRFDLTGNKKKIL